MHIWSLLQFWLLKRKQPHLTILLWKWQLRLIVQSVWLGKRSWHLCIQLQMYSQMVASYNDQKPVVRQTFFCIQTATSKGIGPWWSGEHFSRSITSVIAPNSFQNMQLCDCCDRSLRWGWRIVKQARSMNAKASQAIPIYNLTLYKFCVACEGCLLKLAFS